jgi:hypothetical protein
MVMSDVLRHGWQESSPELSQFLDKMFAAAPEDVAWPRTLRDAARLPPATVLDCRGATISTHADSVSRMRVAGNLFIFRGLQLLAQGQDSDGVEHLLTALGLARHLQHKALAISYLTGLSLEKTVLTALRAWLPKAEPTAARTLLDELGRHASPTLPVTDTLKAEYLMCQNTLNSQNHLAMLYIPPRNGIESGMSAAGTDLVLTAVQMPWEKARRERLLNAAFAGMLRYTASDQPGVEPSGEEDRRKLQYLRYWTPSDTGPDAGLSADRLAALLRTSVVRDMLPMLKNVYQGRQEVRKMLDDLRTTGSKESD